MTNEAFVRDNVRLSLLLVALLLEFWRHVVTNLDVLSFSLSTINQFSISLTSSCK